MVLNALNILTDTNGKTIGATIINEDGNTIRLTTSDLIKLAERHKLGNAIIDINGHVRAKRGNLEKIIVNQKPNAPQQNDISKAQRLIKQDIITVYHGSKDKDMKPNFRYSNNNNDYGKGFYTTPDKELGKEWAYSKYTKGQQGYVYTYKLKLNGLKVLDLTGIDTMHWVAELVYNRKINTEGREGLADVIQTIIQKYKINTSGYDVIIGYRADDSYFSYITDFLSGTIYRYTLENALRYGDLGLQVFVKSEKAFSLLEQCGQPEEVDSKYLSLYMRRDQEAIKKYNESKRFNSHARIKQRVFDFL